MSNLIVVLDILVVTGMVVSAILAVHFEKLLSSVIALGVTGVFAAGAFLLMHAPDVAISEAAVGAVLSTALFVIAIRKTTKKEDEDE